MAERRTALRSRCHYFEMVTHTPGVRRLELGMQTLHTRATSLLGPRSHLQAKKGGVDWPGPGPLLLLERGDVQLRAAVPSQAGGSDAPTHSAFTPALRGEFTVATAEPGTEFMKHVRGHMQGGWDSTLQSSPTVLS